ncbi:MAG: DUF2752 domain-containing protein [Acidobacteriota bacterium]
MPELESQIAFIDPAGAEIPGRTTNNRIFAAAAAGAFAVGSAAVWYFDPTTAGFFPVCPLHSLTGFACPGCGLTRGFHALFHGDIATAIGFNALVPIVAVGMIYVFILFVRFAATGRPIPIRGLRPGWLWAILIVLCIFGILRNLPFYPFNLLFP